MVAFKVSGTTLQFNSNPDFYSKTSEKSLIYLIVLNVPNKKKIWILICILKILRRLNIHKKAKNRSN
jgi:hypothetical protein